jgi:hypothetical protein
LASSIALALVAVAAHLEWRATESFSPPFNQPASMCAFLALLGLTSERPIRLILRSRHRNERRSSLPFATKLYDSSEKITVIAPALSDACFYLLFAAVVSAADIPSVVAGGPAAMAFAFIFRNDRGVVVCQHAPRGVSRHDVVHHREELLTASNAAIGGPSMAAAFAVGLIPGDIDGRGVERGEQRSALVLAATFWGIFGYAIATGVWCSCHIEMTEHHLTFR